MDIYGNGFIHRTLQWPFQAEGLAYPHSLSLKGVGDQVAWVDLKGEGGQEDRGLIQYNTEQVPLWKNWKIESNKKKEFPEQWDANIKINFNNNEISESKLKIWH